MQTEIEILEPRENPADYLDIVGGFRRIDLHLAKEAD